MAPSLSRVISCSASAAFWLSSMASSSATLDFSASRSAVSSDRRYTEIHAHYITEWNETCQIILIKCTQLCDLFCLHLARKRTCLIWSTRRAWWRRQICSLIQCKLLTKTTWWKIDSTCGKLIPCHCQTFKMQIGLWCHTVWFTHCRGICCLHRAR
jgi:hypothetical protein